MTTIPSVGTDELLSCPFCGAQVTLQPSNNAPDTLFVFACPESSPCSGSGLGIYALKSQLAEAIAAWNARSPSNPASPGMGWKTIDSAPLDGTEILAWFGESTGVKQVAWTESGSGLEIWCVDDGKFEPYALRGYNDPYPTHWCPLPAGPSALSPLPSAGGGEGITEEMIERSAEAIWNHLNDLTGYWVEWPDADSEQKDEARGIVRAALSAALPVSQPAGGGEELVEQPNFGPALPLQFPNPDFSLPVSQEERKESATHRHKKRGAEYVLIGIGKMQAEHWVDVKLEDFPIKVDMDEVAIYRSVDDGGLWVRPREEFEDGRFEALTLGGAE